MGYSINRILLQINQLINFIILFSPSQELHSLLSRMFHYYYDGNLIFHCWICLILSLNQTMMNGYPWRIETCIREINEHLLRLFYRILALFILIGIFLFYLSILENTFRIIDPHSILKIIKEALISFFTFDNISKISYIMLHKNETSLLNLLGLTHNFSICGLLFHQFRSYISYYTPTVTYIVK